MKKLKTKFSGFTLAELLGVIVILSILVVIIVPMISRYITENKKNYNDGLEEEFALTGENYFVSNASKLPRNNSFSNFVTLGELESNGLVSGEYIDADKGKCSSTSYVRVIRDFKTNEYSYYACLDCENYKSSSKFCDVGDLERKDNIVKCDIKVNPSSGWSNKFEISLSVKSGLNIKKIYYLNNKYDTVVGKSYSKKFFINSSFLNNGRFEVFIEDVNGNRTTDSSCAINVKYDDSIPVCTLTQKDKNTANVGCKDTGGSGCSGSNPSTVPIYNGKANAIVYDNAGNEGKCSATFDNTPPVCVISKSPSNDWSKGDVTITGTCKDDGSGCASSAVTKTVSSSGTYDLGQVCDNAGNCSSCSASVKIDKTAPTCSVSKSSSATWSNKDVVLTGTCSDTGGSGCASSTVTKTVSSSGTYDFGQVCDNAGNCTSCSGSVNIDKTAPTCTVSKNPSGKWANKNVTVTGTCNDTGGSGCVSSTVTKTAKSTNSYSPGEVCDSAGNCTTCGNIKVNIDKTDPTCTVTISNSNWTNSNVTVTGTCSDTGGSGCTSDSSTVSKTISTEGSVNYSPGTVYDAAGNSKVCPTKTVKIDKTAPYCDGAERDGTVSGNINFKYTFKDNLSGVTAEKHGHCYAKASHIPSEQECTSDGPLARLNSASYKSFNSPGTTRVRDYNYQFSKGTVYILFKLKDAAGNEALCKTHTSPYWHSYTHTWD